MPGRRNSAAGSRQHSRCHGISPAPHTPADEQHAYNLAHLDLAYSRTKHEAERLVLEANDSRLETVVANPGFAFGALAVGTGAAK